MLDGKERGLNYPLGLAKMRQKSNIREIRGIYEFILNSLLKVFWPTLKIRDSMVYRLITLCAKCVLTRLIRAKLDYTRLKKGIEITRTSTIFNYLTRTEPYPS